MVSVFRAPACPSTCTHTQVLRHENLTLNELRKVIFQFLIFLVCSLSLYGPMDLPTEAEKRLKLIVKRLTIRDELLSPFFAGSQGFPFKQVNMIRSNKWGGLGSLALGSSDNGQGKETSVLPSQFSRSTRRKSKRSEY